MATQVTVQDMVKTYLKEHGYDGLCREGCWCGIDELWPCSCDCPNADCTPAYAWEMAADGTPWYSLEKPEGAVGRVGACEVCKGSGSVQNQSTRPAFTQTCWHCGGTGWKKGGGDE